MNNPSNSFSDNELRGMITGNNPVSNAYRELLAYREAEGNPVLYRWRYPEDSFVGATAWQPIPVEQYESFMRLIASKDPEVEIEKLFAATQLPAVPGCLSDEQRDILIKTAQVMFDRKPTSDYSANIREVARLALMVLDDGEPTDDERILAIEGIIQPLDEFDSSSRQFESLRRGEGD